MRVRQLTEELDARDRRLTSADRLRHVNQVKDVERAQGCSRQWAAPACPPVCIGHRPSLALAAGSDPRAPPSQSSFIMVQGAKLWHTYTSTCVCACTHTDTRARVRTHTRAPVPVAVTIRATTQVGVRWWPQLCRGVYVLAAQQQALLHWTRPVSAQCSTVPSWVGATRCKGGAVAWVYRRLAHCGDMVIGGLRGAALLGMAWPSQCNAMHCLC